LRRHPDDDVDALDLGAGRQLGQPCKREVLGRMSIISPVSTFWKWWCGAIVES